LKNFIIRKIFTNRIFIDGEIARIEVIQRNGNVIYFTIDKSDVELVSRYRWFYHNGYCCTTGETGRHMYITWVLCRRPQRNYVLHHINGDKTDNRRANLKLVTWSQHHYLEKSKPNNSTGIRGISKHRNGDYCVVIGPNNKRKVVKDLEKAKLLRRDFEESIGNELCCAGVSS